MHCLAHSSSGYFSLRDRQQNNFAQIAFTLPSGLKGFSVQSGEQVIVLITPVSFFSRSGVQPTDNYMRADCIELVQLLLCFVILVKFLSWQTKIYM